MTGNFGIAICRFCTWIWRAGREGLLRWDWRLSFLGQDLQWRRTLSAAVLAWGLCKPPAGIYNTKWRILVKIFNTNGL